MMIHFDIKNTIIVQQGDHKPNTEYTLSLKKY